LTRTVAITLLILASDACADTLRVPAQYPVIQDAISAAMPGDTVLIADGIYRGSRNTNLNFAGKAITVRSEYGPFACIIDAAHTATIATFITGEGAGSILEGLTLKQGSGSEGGGIRCSGASPTIRGCVFDACWGSYHSSGVGCINGSAPRIENCRFSAGLAGVGGAVHSLSGSHPKLLGCTITGHRTDLFGAGGAGCDATSSITIDRCIFMNNQAIGFSPIGGGVFISGGTATITNSLFINNTAGAGGGAIACSGNARVSITNCTMSGNSGGSGSGAIWASSNSPAAANCIMWNNSPDELGAGTTIVRYSVVSGGWPGPGNLSSDPGFLGGGDFRLAPGSPCIDAGDTASLPSALALDLGGQPRRTDDPATPDTGVGAAPVIDIGAYEFQPQTCYANCDGSTTAPILNVADFICFLSEFAAQNPYANCDNSTTPPVLNVADFVCFQTRYAAGCP